MRTLATRRQAPQEAGRARFTPEHLQLLSDSRLRALAGQTEAGRPGSDPSPFARLASRELRRRHTKRPAA